MTDVQDSDIWAKPGSFGLRNPTRATTNPHPGKHGRMNYAPTTTQDPPPHATESPPTPTDPTAQTEQPITPRRGWNWTLTQRHRSRAKGRLLRALDKHGQLAPACREAKISRTTAYEWMRRYPAFKHAVNERIAATEQNIVASMIQRATNPDDRTGERAGEFMLKALNPDTYTERQKIETTQTTTQTVQVIHEVRHALTTQQADRLKQLRGTIDAPTDDETPALPVPT